MNKQKQFVERIVKWEYALLVVPVMLWAIVPPIVTGKQSVESVLPWDQLKSPTFELTATYHFFYGVFMTATLVILNYLFNYLPISIYRISTQIKSNIF